MSLIDKKIYQLDILTFIDERQNVYFKGRDIALALRYKNTKDALINHVDKKYKIEYQNLRVTNLCKMYIHTLLF